MKRNSPSRTSASSRYRAPALEKGLDILELLSDRPEGLSQSEIARALERSVGEIFRMLNCLVERGYLSIQRPSDRYILTLKLFELANRSAPLNRLLANATPLMKELTNEVHQSCHLVVIEGGHGVVVAQVDSPSHIGFAVRVGTVMNLSTTASGHTLLAFQQPDDRARVLARRAAAEREAFDEKAFESMLANIRTRGYEEMESTRTRGIHDVSFPVFNHRGAAVAALTVPFIERLDMPGDTSLAASRAALSRISARLSASLGGRAPVEQSMSASSGSTRSR
jgi:DNA-binding IclR family transcriptional regulator